MAGSTSRPLEDEPPQYRPVKFFKLENGRLAVDSTAASGSTITTTSNLLPLLDFSSVKSAEISSTLQRLSEVLVYHSRLQLTADGVVTRYQILEAEFYLRDSECHWDPFAHGEAEQEVPGRWYFHRAPRRIHSLATDAPLPRKPPAGHRGGTRKGLDLTSGGSFTTNDSQNGLAVDKHPVTGGILLRTLQRESDGKVISGPSLLVDEVIARSGASDLKDLVESKWAGDSSAFPFSAPGAKNRVTSLFIVPHTPPHVGVLPELFTSPRIGLDLSNASDSAARLEMVDKPYRFFIQPHLLTANGRAHTFFGIFRAKKVTAKPPYTDLVSTIALLTGLSESATRRYIQFYLEGQDTQVEAYVGTKGKGVSGSSEKMLKMLGALEKRREDRALTEESTEQTGVGRRMALSTSLQ
ncbi:hypothetical protein FRB94_007483 [Tulasnella sp. JGI-2019a]|nr:hypothetical protein FRB94_007483 [Tulasnella sp. JGI-2019a]